MIRVDKLNFSYAQGDFQLNLEQLEIADAEHLAIIGPSGSGKSTLLSLLAGILRPSSGRIRVDELALESLSDAQSRDFRLKGIGFVFQNFEMIEYLNGLDNVLNPYRMNPSLKLTKEVRERAKDLMLRTGLAEQLEKYPSTMSQGELQRLAICRALIAKPKYILADEPTGNLDPKNKHKSLDLIFKLIDQEGATLIAVTHDHSILDRFQRILDFNDMN